MQPKKINPFYIEKKRSFYANKGLVNKFKELYSSKYPSISNTNSSKMWDNLNFSRSSNLQDSPIYQDKLLQILKELSSGTGNLLDIGFGFGAIERRLKGSNYHLFGVDISSKSVSELKQSIKGNFIKGDLLKIPFDSNFFDYILCLDVLEHISPVHTFKALKEISRVSKGNSRLIISIPLNEGLEQMIIKGDNPNAHVRVYTSDIIKFELKLSGFAIIKETYLSAFNRNYRFKKILNYAFKLKQPNLLILVVKKI